MPDESAAMLGPNGKGVDPGSQPGIYEYYAYTQ